MPDLHTLKGLYSKSEKGYTFLNKANTIRYDTVDKSYGCIRQLFRLWLCSEN